MGFLFFKPVLQTRAEIITNLSSTIGFFVFVSFINLFCCVLFCFYESLLSCHFEYIYSVYVL